MILSDALITSRAGFKEKEGAGRPHAKSSIF